MKKIIAIGCLTIVMAGLLTACGKFTCDLCGKESSGKKTKITVEGETGVFCSDCKETAEALAALAESLS